MDKNAVSNVSVQIVQIVDDLTFVLGSYIYLLESISQHF
jgi:hypothetical protein